MKLIYRVSFLLLSVCLILFGCSNEKIIPFESNGDSSITEGSLQGLQQGGSFRDVAAHWAKDEIHFLKNQNIVGGYPDGRFGPKDEIKRVHAALMLQRELQFDTSNRPAPNFSDVDVTHPDYDVIATLADEEIITGYEGKFMPNAPLTRAEMAAILQRAYSLQGEGDFEFNDVSSKFWGHEAIQSLVANQITVGYPDRTFQPRSNISRAEFSVFMARTLNDEFKKDVKQQPLKAHFLNVGQGDATLIELPNGKTILIDAGDKSAGEKIVSYLKKAGISSIDLVIATHAHADHIGGLVDVLKQFEIKQIIDSGRTHTSQTYLDYLTYVDNQNLPFAKAVPGTTYDLDPSVTIRFLNTGSEEKSLNDSSVALKLTYNQVSLLFTGDAELGPEEQMVNQYDLSAQILQVGHHGSFTSSNNSFLYDVQPEMAILSYGEGNRYNHPHHEAIQRLRNSGAKLYSLANSGDVIITTDGINYDATASPWDGTGNAEGSGGDEDEIIYPVNINTANFETLQQITGVGEVIAENIINYREQHGPFTSIEQLKNVNRIGPVTFENMKHQITI
ncbi:S-layer homology domain-containing protein [Anaerobacillus sp. MEB173]|uniref:S-layer homology domain-containing protein n=1 Tax=Anaerobacillus sp. MEB173 TaxID=3383345 RepID=UPI003F92B876